MLEKYRNAEKLCPWNVTHAVLNAAADVRKLDDTHFSYPEEKREEDGVSLHYYKVEALSGKKEDLFDHEKLCALLDIPYIDFPLSEISEEEISFVREDHLYHFKHGELTKEELKEERAVSVSPDKKTELSVRDHDLWLKDLETEEEFRLSSDGEEDFAYALPAQYSGYITQKVKGIPEKPDVLWNEDSSRFLTYQLDQRNVKELYIIQSYDEEGSESIRPRLHTYKCPFPEDDIVPLAYFYIGDVKARTLTKVNFKPRGSGGRMFFGFYNAAKWIDSKTLMTTWISRGNKSAEFVLMHADGSAESLVQESSDSFLNIATYGNLDGYTDYCASNTITADRKHVIWQSERDDLARLFLYDASTKELIKAITPKDCSVGELICQDEEYIYFYASNLAMMSDPYYQAVCRVRYDGSDFAVLTEEDAMHRACICCDVIVDTFSRVDLPPQTTVRSLNGEFLYTLVKSDISDLLSRGYIIPERFSVKASDGQTDLYGILIKPADFDPDKSYPFIDYIYGGMQCYNVPKAFAYKGSIEGREIMGGLEEMAQLGFAGIILDGLGTPGRGKKLHDISYENIHGCAGLKDHVYCLKELKEKFPFLDLDRAGMWGNSGGGCATSRAMLEYPDVYKVGVSSAGNHDQRMYNNEWTENYYGLYNREIYLKGDNTALAENLKGHLFIVHGAMDDNVAMSQSIRLIDALIEADKDFDFLILPRVNHNVPANPYFIRKKMDYFVRYLLEEEVPEYHFTMHQD